MGKKIDFKTLRSQLEESKTIRQSKLSDIRNQIAREKEEIENLEEEQQKVLVDDTDRALYLSDEVEKRRRHLDILDKALNQLKAQPCMDASQVNEIETSIRNQLNEQSDALYNEMLDILADVVKKYAPYRKAFEEGNMLIRDIELANNNNAFRDKLFKEKEGASAFWIFANAINEQNDVTKSDIASKVGMNYRLHTNQRLIDRDII